MCRAFGQPYPMTQCGQVMNAVDNPHGHYQGLEF